MRSTVSVSVVKNESFSGLFLCSQWNELWDYSDWAALWEDDVQGGTEDWLLWVPGCYCYYYSISWVHFSVRMLLEWFCCVFHRMWTFRKISITSNCYLNRMELNLFILCNQPFKVSFVLLIINTWFLYNFLLLLCSLLSMYRFTSRARSIRAWL